METKNLVSEDSTGHTRNDETQGRTQDIVDETVKKAGECTTNDDTLRFQARASAQREYEHRYVSALGEIEKEKKQESKSLWGGGGEGGVLLMDVVAKGKGHLRHRAAGRCPGR